MYTKNNACPASLFYAIDYGYPAAIWNCDDQKFSLWKPNANKHSRNVFWITSSPSRITSMMLLKHLLSFENLTLPLWLLWIRQMSSVLCQRDTLVVTYLDTHLWQQRTLVFPRFSTVVAYTVYSSRLSLFEYRSFLSRFGHWNYLSLWTFVTKLPNHSM